MQESKRTADAPKSGVEATTPTLIRIGEITLIQQDGPYSKAEPIARRLRLKPATFTQLTANLSVEPELQALARKHDIVAIDDVPSHTTPEWKEAERRALIELHLAPDEEIVKILDIHQSQWWENFNRQVEINMLAEALMDGKLTDPVGWLACVDEDYGQKRATRTDVFKALTKGKIRAELEGTTVDRDVFYKVVDEKLREVVASNLIFTYSETPPTTISRLQ